jgi:hypothetical protein
MKRLIFLLIIIPVIAFSQNTDTKTTTSEENLKKSAETFVANWFKYWDDKKYNEILNSVNQDASYINLTSTKPLSKNFNEFIDYLKKNDGSYKVNTYSYATDVLSKTLAIVSVKYIDSTIIKSDITVTDNFDIIILEMVNDAWKFKNYYSTAFMPVVFNANIDKKWQKGKVEPVWRFSGAVNQMFSLVVGFIEDYKKNGTNPAQAGKMMGARFAKVWDQSRGFDGLASGMMWSFQTMSTYVEVLERNENMIKFKIEPFQVDEKNWNVTQQELLEFFQNSLNEIASTMGGTCIIIVDTKQWIVTLSKK